MYMHFSGFLTPTGGFFTKKVTPIFGVFHYQNFSPKKTHFPSKNIIFHQNIIFYPQGNVVFSFGKSTLIQFVPCTTISLSLSPDEHSNMEIPVMLYIALKLRHGNRATNRINHVTILLDSGLARGGCFVN